jgi:uncharacterized protein
LTYTIITGASMGIGKALAEQCAQRQRNLILVSLPGEGLPEFAGYLSTAYNIHTEPYEADLTVQEAVIKFYTWCYRNGFRVNTLINNAGLGSQGRFEHTSPHHVQAQIRLNIECLVSMCRNALPLLKQHEQSYILNVASISAFTPVPYKAVYSATKSFVLSFTNSLYYELKQTSISVSCLCPGPTLTNKRHIEKVRSQGLKAKILTTQAQYVAEVAIREMHRKERIIIPGWGNKLFALLAKILPVRMRLWLAGFSFSESPHNKEATNPTNRAE